MRIVALLAVRNEARYLARCLEHLEQQGVETCLLDHDSTDDTPEIARSYVGRGVFRIERLPFDGVFSLTEQLLAKERLAAEIAADWFIHHDADETRYAPAPYANLREGLADVAQQGYNAVDFDEFVFLPTQEDTEFTGGDYVAALRHYYYYEPPSPDRYRINAWRKTDGLDLHTHAGHQAVFPGRRVFPQPFIMRHYLVLNRAHALEKYGGRRFAAAELAQSWHRDRAAFRATDFSFPPARALKKLDATEVCDKSEPWIAHPLFSIAEFLIADLSAAQSPIRIPHSAFRNQEFRIRLRRYQETHAAFVPLIPPVTDSVARPFWSVMIPAFNPLQQHLAATLEAVLRQAPEPSEMQIEVVDDGTADYDLAAFVAEKGRGRVAYYRQPRRLGIVGNWNACLRRVRGLWVHLLHQDDLISDGWYSRLHAALANRPEIVAAFCRASGLNDAGAVTWTQKPERSAPGLADDTFVARLARDNFILTPSLAVRRAFFEEFGGYHEGLPYCADWDLNKRLAVCGAVWYEPEIRAYYREHAASATARLQTDGADFLDRRKSAQLSQAYLPPEIAAATEAPARQAALVWAAEVLRTRLLQADYAAAQAQAREIYAALGELSGVASPPPSHNPQAQEQIERLEAELSAWRRTAEKLSDTL